MRHFDPQSLALFIAVCDQGSIAAAAEQMAIVPSAISKRMTALEDQVGVRLLIRRKRGVVVTPAGEVMLRAARETLSSMERLQAELSEFSHGLQGNLRILASLSAVCQFLPSQISQFMKEHPRVQVNLEEKISALITRGIEEGRADIGLCWENARTHHLHHRHYHTDQLGLVVKPDHPLAERHQLRFEETLAYDHVEILPGSLVSLTLQREATLLGRAIRFRVHVTTFDATFRIVDSGLAVAVVPMDAAGLYAKAMDIRAIPLVDEWATRRFVAFVRDLDALSAPARHLFDYLTESASSSTFRTAPKC